MIIDFFSFGFYFICFRYLDFNFAQDTAAKIKGTEQYITNQLFHDGVRAESKDVLKHLFALSKREYHWFFPFSSQEKKNRKRGVDHFYVWCTNRTVNHIYIENCWNQVLKLLCLPIVRELGGRVCRSVRKSSLFLELIAMKKATLVMEHIAARHIYILVYRSATILCRTFLIQVFALLFLTLTCNREWLYPPDNQTQLMRLMRELEDHQNQLYVMSWSVAASFLGVILSIDTNIFTLLFRAHRWLVSGSIRVLVKSAWYLTMIPSLVLRTDSECQREDGN